MIPRPRGIRNNNPGNIRFDGTKWRGLRGDDGAFCIFDTPVNGIRAIARILGNYQKRGLYTIDSIINAWAPPNENNTQAYIDAVCASCSMKSTDYVSRDEWPQVIAGIIQHENGQQPYTHEQIIAGITASL